ncbi:MAG: type II secretion system protein [Clostridia bacterium]|nr:type II secretion system protein [Clostridia bacterium]
MKHTNKKGFTIVELVIVIAVIAILAAVLIPTFSNLIKKANISNDTAIAKNLNTAAISAQADSFAQAIEAAKEAGYLVAHLNAKADKIFFVWEDETNQFLLYDLDAKKVLYSNTAVTGDPDASWFFAVNTKAEKDAVLTALSTVNCNYLVGDVAALKDVLAAGGEVYLDESLVLDTDNRLEFVTEGANVEITLGSAQLTSNGVIANKFPIDIKKGTVVINGGVVGALGSDVDLDGKVYSTPINSDEGTTVTLNETVFNGDDNVPVQFCGTATLNNVTVNGGYIYSIRNAQVTLNNCEVYNTTNIALWVTNTYKGDDGKYHYDGASTLTVNGGKYEGALTDAGWGIVSVHDGTININGGEFISAEGHMFGLIGTTCPKIVITGGTFNNATFEELVAEGVEAWEALCAGDYNVEISADGKTVTITK